MSDNEKLLGVIKYLQFTESHFAEEVAKARAQLERYGTKYPEDMLAYHRALCFLECFNVMERDISKIIFGVFP